MRSYSGLRQRGKGYSYARRVPADIQQTFGKREVVFGLGTRDFDEAVIRARAKAVELDHLFEAHRTECNPATNSLPTPTSATLAHDTIKTICGGYYVELVDTDFAVKAALFEKAMMNETDFFAGKVVELPKSEPDEWNYWDHLLEDPETTFDEYVPYVHTHGLRERRKALEQAVSAGDCREFKTLADELLRQKQIYATSDARLRLIGSLMQTEIRAITDILVKDQEHIEAKRAKVEITGESSPVPLLSSAVDAWIAENSKSTWSEERREQCASTLRDFILIAGDRAVNSYKKADGRAYKGIQLQLPANWQKRKAIRNLSIGAAAKKAQTLGINGQHILTVNKKIGIVAQCWAWIESQYDEIPVNPVRGLKVNVASVSPRSQRDPFTTADLKSIFAAPIYTGCRSERYWQQAGTIILRGSSKFWIPLIGLFSGMRSNEICQLHVEDIRQDDGGYYFSINEDTDDKLVKTAASLRDVPIHPFLIDCGLLTLVEEARRNGNRLFPDLKPAKSGRSSDAFGKHFARHLKSVGVKRAKITFHSFRHTFEDAARNSGLRAEHIDALQGHVSPGMGGRYGKGYGLKLLSTELKKVRHPDLDLRHLVQSNRSG